jgi:hypothetical protein
MSRPRNSLSHQAHLPGRQVHGYRKMVITPRTKAGKEAGARQTKETKQEGQEEPHADGKKGCLGLSETETTRREDRMGRISGHEKAEEQPLAPGTPPGATDARIQEEGNTPRTKAKTKKQGRKWERADSKQRALGIGNVYKGRKACKRDKIPKI